MNRARIQDGAPACVSFRPDGQHLDQRKARAMSLGDAPAAGPFP